MKKIAVLPGDGIGPEVMKEALKILDAAIEKYSLDIEYEVADFGGIAIDKWGSAFPEHTKRLCEESFAILLGSIGGPKWEKLPPEKQPERAGLLKLRKSLDLYANIRPVIVYKELVDISPLKQEIIGDGIDFVIVRELTGGIYFGEPKYKDSTKAYDTLLYNRYEVERIARFSFELARKRNKKVTCVDKANVLVSSVFWREVVKEVHKEYPDIELNFIYVDNASMQIIKNPRQFDVILTTNMFGDILSDEAAAIPGSLGLLPSASINEKGKGLYEPIGGSAPDIAGKNVANPIAQILSLAMMLRISFDRNDIASKIENAVWKTIQQFRTQDIYTEGKKLVSTSQMGDKILDFFMQ
jgi:3-isopropylmalate dehydrogenase